LPQTIALADKGIAADRFAALLAGEALWLNTARARPVVAGDMIGDGATSGSRDRIDIPVAGRLEAGVAGKSVTARFELSGHLADAALVGHDGAMDDPGLYDVAQWRGRPKLVWPEGRTCALWVAPNLETYEIDPPAHPRRKSWARPHPDVVGYAHRDYANRVGHMRMADVMSEFGFPGSVSLSVALCQHHPAIVADAAARGWEFFSHGIYNTRYAYDMDPDQERAIIRDSIDTVEAATGQRIRGWLAPALTHTVNTLDLIAEAGLDYTCDLYHDDQPTLAKTKHGAITAIPYSLEVNDHYGFFIYNMSPREYADTLIRQYERLAREGEASGTVMCIPLHSYLIGQPHRIGPFRDVLRHIANDGRAWVAKAGEIVDAYRAQVPGAGVSA